MNVVIYCRNEAQSKLSTAQGPDTEEGSHTALQSLGTGEANTIARDTICGSCLYSTSSASAAGVDEKIW